MPETKKYNFSEILEKTTRGLVYISEIDSEVEPFRGGRSEGTGLEEFRRAAGLSSGVEIETGDLEFIKDRLTENHDWHSSRDKDNAEGFSKVFDLLERNLSDLRLYRVGRMQVTLYVVGTDRKGRMRGITMRAVET